MLRRSLLVFPLLRMSHCRPVARGLAANSASLLLGVLRELPFFFPAALTPARGARMLTIQGLTVRLGGRTILDRASATIQPGSKVGLIGRNGAGKSTLMKAIIGELEPDEGGIEIPKTTRQGYLAQAAPAGSANPLPPGLAAHTRAGRGIAGRETRRIRGAGGGVR